MLGVISSYLSVVSASEFLLFLGNIQTIIEAHVDEGTKRDRAKGC